MSKLGKTGLAALAMAALSHVAAAQSAPLSCLGFEDAMLSARLSDPAVETVRAEKRQAEADVTEAKSLYRPQISAFGRTGVGDTGIIDTTVQNQVGLRAEQRIYDFGDAKFARRAARHNVTASNFDLTQAEINAGIDAAAAILGILEAEEQLEFTRERREYFSQQLEAVQELLKEGGATVTERADVAARLAEAEAFALELEFRRDESLTNLEIVTGREGNICSEPALVNEFATIAEQPATIEEAVDAAMTEYPELQALYARADSLQAEAERRKRERLPVISVVGVASYGTIGGTSDQFELQERVGVDVAVPLYSGNALSARRNRAGAQEAAARGQANAARRRLEQDVRITYRRILSLEAQLVSRKEVEARSKEQFEAAEFEYEMGTLILPELVEVRLEYEASGLQRIAAKYEMMRQKLRLMSLTGKR